MEGQRLVVERAAVAVLVVGQGGVAGGQLGLSNSSVVWRMHWAVDFPMVSFAVLVRARAVCFDPRPLEPGLLALGPLGSRGCFLGRSAVASFRLAGVAFTGGSGSVLSGFFGRTGTSVATGLALHAGQSLFDSFDRAANVVGRDSFLPKLPANLGSDF